MAKVKISDLTAAAALDGTELIEGEQDGGSVQITAANVSRCLYKRYVALLSQSGTDAPVATVLENTLGGTVVWTRNDVGDYTGTLAGAFTVGKTFVVVAPINGFININKDLDSILIQIIEQTLVLSDEYLNLTAIEIRVYP